LPAPVVTFISLVRYTGFAKRHLKIEFPQGHDQMNQGTNDVWIAPEIGIIGHPHPRRLY